MFPVRSPAAELKYQCRVQRPATYAPGERLLTAQAMIIGIKFMFIHNNYDKELLIFALPVAIHAQSAFFALAMAGLYVCYQKVVRP